MVVVGGADRRYFVELVENALRSQRIPVAVRMGLEKAFSSLPGADSLKKMIWVIAE